MNKYFLFAFALFGLLLSCNDSELFTPGDEFLGGGITAGTYQVELNGNLWKFDDTTEAQSDAIQSYINGSNDNGNTISISKIGTLSTGTYTEADGTMVVLMMNNGIYSNVDEDGEFLPFELKITSVNQFQGHVSGRFSGMVSNMTTGEVITLTNGIFVNIEFETGVISTAKLKGDFNEVEKDFSINARAEGVTTAALIVGENQDQLQTLSITIPGGLSEEIFTEEDLVKVQVNLGTTTNPSDVYTNYDPLTDTFLPTTVNITSVELAGENTTGNVKGTFSGTIAKFVNGEIVDEVEITNGEIDVPIVVLSQN